MEWFKEVWDTLSPILGTLNIVTLIGGSFAMVKGILTIIKQSKEIKDLAGKIRFVDESVKAQKAERDAAVAENELLKKSNAVMFKAISYLVSASKIATEDKLDILEDIMELKQPVAEAAKEDVEVVKETVTDVITEVAEKTKSLIDKYIGEK